MIKKNYKLLMDEEIERIKVSGKKPALLLHACCAPCSSAVLEQLKEYFDITLFFYNPNISPESEFLFRLDELKKLVDEMGMDTTKVISPLYNPDEFYDIAKGLESLPEGSERCARCYKLRLERSFLYAKESGFDYVTTTLSISPYKNAQRLNEIGAEFSEKHGVKYLYSDFKKGDGYKRSIELSALYNLYRQNYCGCIYSKNQSDGK